MNHSAQEAEAFNRIVERLGDPEVRRDLVRVWLAAAATLTIAASVILAAGWGWPAVVAFCATFVPGVAATTGFLRRRLRRRAAATTG